MTTQIEQLIEDFELLDEWEDRYRYVIELGRDLPPLPEEERSPANKVKGCASQVWLSTSRQGDDTDPVLTFAGDSDAHIVKGLIAVLFKLYSGKHASAIIAIEPLDIFAKFGLTDHLTPQRSNGLFAMVGRIREDARMALGQTSVH